MKPIDMMRMFAIGLSESMVNDQSGVRKDR